MYGDRVYGGPGSQYQSHYRNHYTSSASSSPISSRKFYHDKSSSPSTERLNGSFNRGKDGIFRPKSLYSSATEIDFDSAKASFPARSVPITIATNPRLAQIRARHREDSIPRQISRDYDYPSLSPSPRTRSHTLENKSNYNSNFNDNLSYLSNASRVSNSNYSSTSSSSYYPSRQRSNYVSRYPAYNFTTNLYSAKVRERPLLSNLNQKYGARKQSTSSSRNASISSASSSHTNSVSSNEPARPALERNKFLIKFRENNINQSSERRRSSISWDIPGSFAHTNDKPSARAEVNETINENEIEPSLEPSKLNINAEIIDDASANDNKLARWNGSMSLNVLDNPNLIEPENKLEPKLIKDSVIRTINCFDICTSQELKHELKLECKKIRSKSEKIKKKKKKIEKESSSENATEPKPETRPETKLENKLETKLEPKLEPKPETKSTEIADKPQQIEPTSPTLEDNKKAHQIFETKKEVKDLTLNELETKESHKDGVKVKFDLKPTHIKAKSIGSKLNLSKFEPNKIAENLQTKAKTEIKSAIKSHIKTKPAEEATKIAQVYPEQVSGDKIKTADKIKQLKIDTVEIENVNQGKKEETNAQILSNQTTEIKSSEKSQIKEKSTEINIFKIAFAQDSPVVEINKSSNEDKVRNSKFETKISIDNKSDKDKIENVVPVKTAEIKPDLKPKKIRSKSTTDDSKVSKIESTNFTNQSKIETSVSNETKEIKTDLKSSKITSKSTAEDAKVSKIETTNLIVKNHSKIENIVPTIIPETKTDLKPKKIKSATENAKISKIESTTLIVKNQSKIETPVLNETKEIIADLKSSKITSKSTADDAQISPTSLIENNKNKIENDVPAKTTGIKADLKPKKIKSKSTAEDAKVSKIETTNLSNQSKIENAISTKTTEIKVDLKPNKIKSKSTTEDNKGLKIVSTTLIDNNENKIKTNEIKTSLKPSKIVPKSAIDDVKVSKVESTTLVENIIPIKTAEIKTDLKQKKIKSKSTMEDNKVFKIVSTTWVDNNESKIDTNEINADVKLSKITPKSSINDDKVPKIESTTLVDNIVLTKTNEVKVDRKDNKIKSKSTMEDKIVLNIKSTKLIENAKQVELKSLNTTSSSEKTTSELCKTTKLTESKISKIEPEQVITKKVQTVIQPLDSKQTEKVIKPEKEISTNKIKNKSQAILSSQKTENKVSKLKVSKELKTDSQQISDKILNGEVAQFSPTKSLFAPNQLPAKSVSLNVTIKDKNNNDLELVQEENLDDIETVTLKSPKTPLSPIKSPFDLVSKPELVTLPKKLDKQQFKDIETKESPVQVLKSKLNEAKEKTVIISQEPSKNVLPSVPTCEPLSPKSNLVQIPAPSTSHQSVTVKKDKASTSSENDKKDSSKKVVKKKKKIKKSPTDELSANLDKIVNEPTIIEELRKSNETLENRTNQCAPSPISTPTATTNNDLQVKLTVPIKKQPLEFVDPYRVVKKPTKKIRFREYSINDFTFLTVLGRGSFGKVLLAELRDHGVYFAIKCLKKQTVIEDDDVESIMIERKVLAYGSNNPFICKLFATFQTESHLFFAMEFCSGGDLMFHVQKETKFSEDKARFYACEILCALSFLHKRSIIYRDLKLDNIIVYKDGHTRLVDFGMCQGKIYREEFLPSNFCGTPEYMAPEIIKGVRYNQSVDFWAFGVVIYEMCVGTSPFQGTDEDELLWNVCHQEVHYPRFLSDQVVDLISLLLKKDPQDRLGPADCKYGSVSSQQWFHKVDWKLVEQCKIKPPFIPQLMHETDVSYFDRYFTKEEPCISPSLTPISLKDQELFNGFNYTNHHMTE